MRYDVIIVGGGIVGLATAYQLVKARPDLKLAIIEKEEKAAQHQTGHNSGVIHSGIYYKPNSSKAINCIKGYRYLLDFCDEHKVPYNICGKLIVATRESELTELEKIHQRGIANGLTGIQSLNKLQVLEKEPHVNAVAALWVPQAGIINYKQVAEKYLEIVREQGASWYPSQALYRVIKKGNTIKVFTDKRELECCLLITCAGLYADKIAKMTKQSVDFQILPFRGEYYDLKPEREHLVNQLIYPVPDPNFPFLGVHFTPMIQGGVEAGPNAVLAFRREGYNRWQYNAIEFRETLKYSGFKKLARKFWKTGLKEQYRSFSKRAFVKELQRMIPEIKSKDLKRAGAGVRAMACDAKGNLIDDFLVLEQQGIINVCNAPSPAATASLAIGEMITERALKQLVELGINVSNRT